MLKRTRYTTLALLSAFAAAPAALGGLDVTYSEITFTGDIESPDWEFVGITEYSISPAGNVVYSGNVANNVLSIGSSGLWVDPIEYLPGGLWQYNSRQRLLRTGDQILNASGGLITVLGPYSPVLGDNDTGTGTPAPIVYAMADVGPGFTGDVLYSWSGLATALNRNPILDNGLSMVNGFTIQSTIPWRANGMGANMIAEVGISGPGLPGGASQAAVTFEAPASAPELIQYAGQIVPGSAAPNAIFGAPIDGYVNAGRDAVVVAAFVSNTLSGRVITKFDHSSGVLGLVAETGQAAPGIMGATYSVDFAPLGLNNTGQHVFITGTDLGINGVYADRNTGSGVELLLKTGDEAPAIGDPAITINPSLIAPALNGHLLSESGKFFLLADLIEGGNTSSALYVGDLDGTYKLIVREGDPVIGIEGATFTSGHPIEGSAKGPNESGQITFETSIVIPNVGAKQAIFLTDLEDRPHLIAIQGDGIILYGGDGPGTVFYRASDVRMPQITDSGMMVYLAESNQFSSTFYLFCTSVDLFGDIDKNGVRDAADIDALAAAINAGSILAKWDMNGDNSVDSDDFDYWVGPIAMTVQGDTDLDGDVDDTDLGVMINNFTGPGGSGKGWATGDADGDGDVDDTDLGLAINNFTGPL